MNWKIGGLLGAALALMLSCGLGKDDAMRLKEGSTLEDVVECPALLCADPTALCTELYFEYGRSPPLCVPENICERMDCLEEGRRCVIFEGIPFEARCIK